MKITCLPINFSVFSQFHNHNHNQSTMSSKISRTPTNNTSKYTPSSSRKRGAASNDLTEYIDSPVELAAKVKVLAGLVRSAAHGVAFTGAGISHSSGIPTYRGPDGVWTRMDKGLSAPQGVNLEDAVPTQGHMAIVELLNKGYLKHLVSTNVDGLHRRSGVTQDQLSELRQHLQGGVHPVRKGAPQALPREWAPCPPHWEEV